MNYPIILAISIKSLLQTVIVYNTFKQICILYVLSNASHIPLLSEVGVILIEKCLCIYN